mmetsp:Transcript_9846/g.12851  ORF Transcript_9846/g.12851 Transcript_9846/m.12851 type:complete len:94 (-) Transcript_9846:104-385(-)
MISPMHFFMSLWSVSVCNDCKAELASCNSTVEVTLNFGPWFCLATEKRHILTMFEMYICSNFFFNHCFKHNSILDYLEQDLCQCGTSCFPESI